MDPSNQPPTQVLLVDSCALAREVISEVIEQTDDLTVIAAAGSIAESFDLLDPTEQCMPVLSPDIAVVASTLIDGDAVGFLNQLRRMKVDLPSIVLTTLPVMTPREFISAGAVAHVYKNVRGFQLCETIRKHQTRK